MEHPGWFFITFWHCRRRCALHFRIFEPNRDTRPYIWAIIVLVPWLFFMPAMEIIFGVAPPDTRLEHAFALMMHSLFEFSLGVGLSMLII